MFCANCGSKIEENSKFCHHCGANIDADLLIPKKAKKTVDCFRKIRNSQRVRV